MRRRISGVVAVALSVALHVMAAVLIVGSSLWRGWPSAPVDVEISGMRMEDLQDLPLGGPASGVAADVTDEVVAPPPQSAVPPSPLLPNAIHCRRNRNRSQGRNASRACRWRPPTQTEEWPRGRRVRRVSVHTAREGRA